MGANTYSNKPNASWAKNRPAAKRANRKKTSGPSKIPGWAPYAAAAFITLMVCLTVNFRAFSELNQEVEQHDDLNQQIESLTNDNLALQEEIHYLKSDSSVIEREAKKLGLNRDKKVSVPATK